jgi:hypothetical protein
MENNLMLMPCPDEHEDLPSRVRLILVKGKRESLISSTTSVRVKKAGSCFVNFIIWPGNQDGGAGNRGLGIRERAIEAEVNRQEIRAQVASFNHREKLFLWADRRSQ